MLFDDTPRVLSRSVSVAQDGTLRLSLYIAFCRHVDEWFSAKIPDHVVALGSDEIAKYVDSLVREIIEKEIRDRETYRENFKKNVVALTVKVGKVMVKGIVRPSEKNRGAVFDVELISPPGYHKVDGIYPGRYSGGSQNLVEKSGKINRQALAKARKLLVKMFNDAKHHELHAESYKIAKEVNSTR